jgi:ubiquinone/menaquinone biosynthesis C-methylase UbiE
MSTAPTSTVDEVRKMYEDTADSYARMMDTEIGLPVYADVLGRLQDRIAHTPGAVVDTACGPGHMLFLYRERYDEKRPLLGVDLSPRMVAIAGEKLGSNARVFVGDMRELPSVKPGSSSAVLNFFALHHLDREGVNVALREWHRILAPGGQLVIATWEGSGVIDYGAASDIVALRYRSDELATWAREAGFSVTRCVVEPVEDFPMDAVYLEGCKAPA